MIDSEILRTLQTAVRAAVAASTVPALPIKNVDIKFDVPNDQKYLEAVFIPNNGEGEFWGNERNYQGMFRLILHWPKTGVGPYAAMDVLASVCAYFTKDTFLGPVKITEPPNFTGTLDQGAEILYPASLRYQRFS